MNDEVKLSFGHMLKALRESHGMTQAMLAEKCDLHHSFISLIERGVRQPTLQTMLHIAKAFNMSVAELVKDFEDKLKPNDF